MKILIEEERQVEIRDFEKPGVDVSAGEGDAHLGSMELFVASVALCTYSLLKSYGERFGADADDITMRVSWKYAEHPYRIGSVDMAIRWPALPESRLDAATRAARYCTLHATLESEVLVETLIEN